MDAQLKRVEVEAPVPCDDDFPVENRAVWQLTPEWVDEIGKVSVERFLVAALDQDFIAVPEDERSEAVPLGLVDPSLSLGQLAHALGEHRQNGRIDG